MPNDYDIKLRIGGTGTLSNYSARFTGPVDALDDTERNDDARDHEITGEIVDGVDTYGCKGVPLAFATADDANAWTLDLDIDLGEGWVEQVPTDLNAGLFEIRGKGHYRLWMTNDTGMIVRRKYADKPDQIADEANTVAVGNVRGGTDSFKAWPPEAVVAKGDSDAEWRIANAADSSWRDLETIALAMDF